MEVIEDMGDLGIVGAKGGTQLGRHWHERPFDPAGCPDTHGRSSAILFAA